MTAVSSKSSGFPLFFCICFAVSSSAFAQSSGGSVKAPSYPNPYKLPLIGEVRPAASDARSLHFQQSVLPAFQNFVRDNLVEYSNFKKAKDFVLDPTRLYLPLATNKPVRIYFVHEGSMYRNQLGVSILDAGHGRDGLSKMIEPLQHGKLIFPDASYKNPPDGMSPGGPLSVGDFVEIGTIAKGKQLDFFLLSNGAGGVCEKWAVLSNFVEMNHDGLQHVITAYFSEQFPGFILISFEDVVGGGDRDYNDCVFVVDIGYDFAVRENTLPH